jgi:putative ABC transport system permease protein
MYARELTGRLPGLSAVPVRELTSRAGLFVVLERFHLAIALVTIVASTVFLLALTVMLVDERRETVGVLRLIGLTSRRILVQVFAEGLIIAGAGGLFGIALALASQGLINRYFQWRYDTALVFVRITPDVIWQSLAIAVPLGVAGSVLASWALLRRGALTLVRR